MAGAVEDASRNMSDKIESIYVALKNISPLAAATKDDMENIITSLNGIEEHMQRLVTVETEYLQNISHIESGIRKFKVE
jgi:hypothetical protein